MKDPDVPEAPAAMDTADATEVDERPAWPVEGDADDTECDATDVDRPDEDDSEAFFRWLPTMWLNHRRQKELAIRSSSDGGDFVAYAASARPMAAAPLRPTEPTEKVVLAGASKAMLQAPTVVLPRRRRLPRWLLVSSIAAALGVVLLDLGLWVRRTERVSPAPESSAPARVREMEVARAIELQGAPALSIRERGDASRTLSGSAAPLASVDPPSESHAPGPALRRVLHPNVHATSRMPKDTADTPKAAPTGSAALSAKDLYFEEP